MMASSLRTRVSPKVPGAAEAGTARSKLIRRSSQARADARVCRSLREPGIFLRLPRRRCLPPSGRIGLGTARWRLAWAICLPDAPCECIVEGPAPASSAGWQSGLDPRSAFPDPLGPAVLRRFPPPRWRLPHGVVAHQIEPDSRASAVPRRGWLAVRRRALPGAPGQNRPIPGVAAGTEWRGCSGSATESAANSCSWSNAGRTAFSTALGLRDGTPRRG